MATVRIPKDIRADYVSRGVFPDTRELRLQIEMPDLRGLYVDAWEQITYGGRLNPSKGSSIKGGARLRRSYVKLLQHLDDVIANSDRMRESA